ncbi:hypothetical protein HY492_02560 [Candidatus Woesearchaeota archaeon]|nr:hypothetical protein [Candidatus Woesearchaeota archaeon]
MKIVLFIIFLLFASTVTALYVPDDPEMPARVQECVDKVRQDLIESPFMQGEEGPDQYLWFSEGYQFCLMMQCKWNKPLCPNDRGEEEYYACIDVLDKRGEACVANAPSIESIVAGTPVVVTQKEEEKECRQITDTLAKYGDEEYRSDCKNSFTLRTYQCTSSDAPPVLKDIDCTKVEYAPGKFYKGCSHPDGIVADCTIAAQDRTLAELQNHLSGVQSSAELHRLVHRLTPGEFDLIQENKDALSGHYSQIMLAQANIDALRKVVRSSPGPVSEFYKNAQESWQIDVIAEMSRERSKEAAIAEEYEQLRREIVRMDAENDARDAYLNSWKYTYDKSKIITSVVAKSLWEQVTAKGLRDEGGIEGVWNSNKPFHEKLSASLGPWAFTPLGDAASIASLPSLMADPGISRDGKILAGVNAALPFLDIPDFGKIGEAVTTALGELPTTVLTDEFDAEPEGP